MEKAKGLSGEALKVVEKRRERQRRKGKKVINAKKQRKTIWDRDPFEKIRDTKGIFHAKMGTIKDRNSMDLIKAEDIKKR